MAFVIPALPMTGNTLKASLDTLRQNIPIKLGTAAELTMLSDFMAGDRCLTPEGCYEIVPGLAASPGATVLDLSQPGLQAVLAADSPVADMAALLADTRPASLFPEGMILSTRADAFVFRVAPATASDHHLTTAGGLKLHVLPGADGFDLRAFGASGDGLSDDSAAMEKALDAAQAAGPDRTLWLRGGDYGFSRPVHVTQNDTTIRFERDARLAPLQKTSAIHVTGTAPGSWTALAADAPEGATRFTLSSAPGWAVGSWVELRSEAALPGTNNEGGKACVIGRITEISGTSVTLDRPLPYDFLTADSATAGQPEMIENVVIDGARINRVDYGEEVSFGLYLAYCANVTILSPQIFGSKPRNGADTGTGVNAIKIGHGSIDIRVTDPKIAHVGWYGISVAGYCENIRVTGGEIRDCRHAISVVWRVDNYGEPHNLLFSGVTGRNCNLSVFDTHDTGRGIVFDGCRAFGSRTDSGFQIRNQGTVIRGCESAYNAYDGIVGRNSPTDLRVENCKLYRNGRNGVNSAAPVQIVGGEISDNAQDTTAYAVSCPGGRILGTKLRGRLSGSGANSVVFFKTAAAPAVNAPLVISGVDAPSTQPGQWFVQKVGARHCQEITIGDSDIRGYVGNLVRGTMNPGEPGPRRSNNIATATLANRAGRVTLTGASTTVSNPDIVRRTNNPLWASTIRLTRMVSGTADGVLSVGTITHLSGFTILSTEANDDSVVEWEITG